MSRCHDRFRIQLSIILDLLYALVVFFCVDFGANVWVTRAVFHHVPDFFAAVASDFQVFLFKIFVILILIIFVILFTLMLGVLATGLLLAFFSAAPPDLATEFTPMRSTTPVEILSLDIVFAAVLANLLEQFFFAPPHLKLLNPVFHFLTIDYQGFLLLFKLNFGLEVEICFIIFDFHLTVNF